jgi:hypothetical protein
VFDHRNSSIQEWLVNTVFLGNATGGGNPSVQGFYVDDGWSSNGPSEMDKDSVAKMGLSPGDVSDMIAAWKVNQGAWRDAVYAHGLFDWWFFYGGQQVIAVLIGLETLSSRHLLHVALDPHRLREDANGVSLLAVRGFGWIRSARVLIACSPCGCAVPPSHGRLRPGGTNRVPRRAALHS